MMRNEDLPITMEDDEPVGPTLDEVAIALLPVIVSLTLKQTHFDTLTPEDMKGLWQRAYVLATARLHFLESPAKPVF